MGAFTEIGEEGGHLGGDLHARRTTADDGHCQDALWRPGTWARGPAPGIAKCGAQAQSIVQAPEGVEVILQPRPRLGCDTARVEYQILVTDGAFGGFEGLLGEVDTRDFREQELAGPGAEWGDG